MEVLMSGATVWTDHDRTACLGRRFTIRIAPAVVAMFPEMGTAQRGLLTTADITLETSITTLAAGDTGL